MLFAPIPANESARIESLRRMLLLATPDEESFDRITRVVQRVFNAPIALISLIDSNRQWFKSCIGLPVRETGRDVSFCGHAILNDGLFVIEDARQDDRFADNPLVVGPPHVIFYAGRPLKNADGHMVGTLCVIDHEPRTFSPSDRQALDDLGHWVESVFLNRDLSETQLGMISELEDTRRDALLDPMLNLWSQKASIEICKREVKRAFDGKRPLSIAMISLMNLDTIRTQHGDDAARTALISGARSLLTLQRSYDTLGRFDENEFIAILPDADPALAQTLAARMQDGMDFPFLVGEEIVELPIRIGLASADFVRYTPQASDLIDAAKAALNGAPEPGA